MRAKFEFEFINQLQLWVDPKMNKKKHALEVAGSEALVVSKKKASVGRRKGNPGTRVTGKSMASQPTSKKTVDTMQQADAFSQDGPMGVIDSEQPLGKADQERLDVIKQIQEQIIKRGSEPAGIAEDDFEVERLLHGHVSMCHNAAMEFMKSDQTRAASRILRQCLTFMESKLPPRVASIVLTKGIMHTVFNNLAQHANMVADMNASIEYLERALKAGERPETDQDLLPLAETYLNLANGMSFLNKYDQALSYAKKALKFAKIKCNRLRYEIQDERQKGDGGPSSKLESLEFQLSDFIAIKIMAHLCVGEQHEKQGNFNMAIKLYGEGKQFAETNFGTRHPLYTKCINSMGGAKLKSKYQTKDVFRQVEASTKTKPSSAKDKQKMKEGKVVKAEETIQSKLMARRLNALSANKRRNIQAASTVVRDTDVRMSNMMRRHQDNLLLANCDSWTSMHCRHAKPPKRESLLVSLERSQRKRRSRPSSAMTCDKRISREQRIQHEILDSMTGGKRAPFQIVCKVGPSCQNHNWTQRSPLRKVCTRGPNCPNHDWDCSFRSSVKGSARRSVRSLQVEQDQTNVQPPPPQPPQIVPQQSEPLPKEVEVSDNKSNHSCMLEQTERLHQQQMQHMRSLQDDQFKMLQLVIESQQNRQSSSSYPPMVYYPTMYGQQGYYQPQFYNQGVPGGYQYPMHYYHNFYQSQVPPDGATDDFSEQSDSDVPNEAEHLHEGSRFAQSEQSKADRLEQVYRQKQEEIEAMQRRMAEMQSLYNQQQELMRVQQEGQRAQELASKFEKPESQVSDSKRFGASLKRYKEDQESDDLQRSADNLVMTTGTKASPLVTNKIMKDQSAQAFESFQMHNSILKNSSFKSRVNYLDGHGADSTVKEKASEASIHKSNRSLDQSNRLQHSLLQSEKSFRIDPELNRMGKNEAATKIQKNFRAYRARYDYELIRKRGKEKQHIFRATVRGGDEPQILTCSVVFEARKTPEALTFVLSAARRAQDGRRMDVDLRRFTIRDMTDFKDKVLRIIRKSFSAGDILGAIRAAFQSPEARDILEAEFLPSDDLQAASSVATNQLTDQHGSQDSLAAVREEKLPKRQPVSNGRPVAESSGVTPDVDALIDAEIERIRKRCDVEFRVNVDKVKVVGHKRQMDEYEKSYEEGLSKSLVYDTETEAKEIVIKRVGVRKRKTDEARIDGDDSQHDYEYVVGSDDDNLGKTQVVDNRNRQMAAIKLQSLVRRFLARVNYSTTKRLIYNRVLTRNDRRFRFLLAKDRRSDNYSLSATDALDVRLTRTVSLAWIPFADDQAAERFAECLDFAFNQREITVLSLGGQKLVENTNPFLDTDTHCFITDYQETKKCGEFLVKKWLLRGKYACELHQIRTEQGGHLFKVYVKHQRAVCYLKLHRLPEDIFYMCYYLNETLFFSMDMEYLYMTKLASLRVFHKQMDELEIKFFGVSKSQLGSLPSTARVPDYSRTRPIGKQLETVGEKTKEFVIQRYATDYTVELFDETKKNGRFQIVVKRKRVPGDTDWIHLNQVSMKTEELIRYIKENLKVYRREDGMIDYLSLTHDISVHGSQQQKESVSSRGQAGQASGSQDRIDKKTLMRSRATKGQKLSTVQPKSHQEDFSVDQSIDLSQSDDDAWVRTQWEEITRVSIGHSLFAILMAKKSVPMLPQGASDSEFYKVVLQNPQKSLQVGEVSLHPSACHRLLQLDSSSDLLVNKSAHLPIQEIVAGRVADSRQDVELRLMCSYEKNKQRWTEILRSVVLEETSGTVKFNVWAICQSNERGQSLNEAPLKPSQVNIEETLTAKKTSIRGQPERISTIRSDHIDSKVDDGHEGNMSERTKKSDDEKHLKPFKLVRKSPTKLQPQAPTPMERMDSFADFPDELVVQSRCQGIVKTKDNRYLNMVLAKHGDKYLLSLFNKFDKRGAICENLALPQTFIAAQLDRRDEDLDELTRVRRAVELTLKTSDSITNAHDSKLNTAIFNRSYL